MTKQELVEFEQSVADHYCAGHIRAPIHLSDGNEEQLIEIFKMVKPEDWVYSTWRSHYHALLKGIPKELVRAKIDAGESITLMIPEHKFFSSAIVGGVVPLATGTALGVKMAGGKEHVWCFIGDMAASIGIFEENLRYATNHDLPITFVIEDNTQSVGTPTSVVWGLGDKQPTTSMPVQVAPKVWRYDYTKSWPHVGAGKFVTF